MFLFGNKHKAVSRNIFLGAVRKLRKAGKFRKDLQVVNFQQTNRAHLRPVERGIPFTERRKHVLGRLDPVEHLFHFRFGNAALEAGQVRILVEVEAEKRLVVLDAGKAGDGKQELRRRGGRHHEVEVRQHGHLALVLREHGCRRPFTAGIAQHHGRNLAGLELELHESQEPQFAKRAREVFPGQVAIRFQNAVRRVHHPEHVGGIGHAARLGDALEHLSAMCAIVAEAFLDPPGENVLVQAEGARPQELVRLLRGVQKRIFLFEPALLREEVENQREFVLGGLRRNLCRRHEGRRADLVATAVERPVRIDAEFTALCQREYEAHMPVQQAAVFRKRLGGIDSLLRLDFEGTREVGKSAIHGRTRNLGTPQQELATHLEQEGAEFLVLANGHSKAQFIERESTRTAMVQKVHAAALPRFHLFETGDGTGLVREKGHHFGLDQGVVQEALLAVGLCMYIAKQRLRHTVKKTV